MAGITRMIGFIPSSGNLHLFSTLAVPLPSCKRATTFRIKLKA